MTVLDTSPHRRELRATATPTPRHRRAPRNPAIIDRFARIIVALALAAGVAWMILNATTVRMIEAHLAAFWMNGIIDRGVTATGDIYTLWIAPTHLVGFQVTAECTAVILIAPLLALGAALMLTRRTRWIRGLLGIAAMIAITTAVNQLRLALIGWCTQQWGIEAGYEFSHRFAGSAIGILGFVLGLVLMIVIMGIRRKR